MPDVDVNVSYLTAARKRLGDRLAHNAVDMCAKVVMEYPPPGRRVELQRRAKR